MPLVWKTYQTDLGLSYPFISVGVRALAEIYRDSSPLLILPERDRAHYLEFNNSCRIFQLTPRKIKVFFADDSVYEFNYYRPFDLALFDSLSNSISIRAFEFVGEQIRYSRLTRMLNRG